MDEVLHKMIWTKWKKTYFIFAFYFCRKNPHLAHEIKYNDIESLKTSNFDSRRLTKILIHGFADSATEQSITYYLFDLKNAYLRLADVNVTIVDYSLFAMPLFYLSGFPDVTGSRLAEFLSFLVQYGDTALDSFHLIGFSVGAHVAGIAGHALKGQLGRITGKTHIYSRGNFRSISIQYTHKTYKVSIQPHQPSVLWRMTLD